MKNGKQILEPRQPKRKTNEELINEIMRFSNFGALSQMFVMDALLKQAKAVAEADARALDNGFVNGEAWKGVAQEIYTKIHNHLTKE